MFKLTCYICCISSYRMDVVQDGTGVETAGWFRSSRENNTKEGKSSDDGNVMSRLCALQWVIVLYESVVPDPLKADVSYENTYLYLSFISMIC